MGAAQHPRIYPGVHPLHQHQGSSAAAYLATQAQTYSVTVSLDGHLLAQSPHTLLVKPAVICGAMSTAEGAGISLAAVAPRSSAFTIQAVRRASCGPELLSSCHAAACMSHGCKPHGPTHSALPC